MMDPPGAASTPTAGESTEPARATRLEYVDLDSGHWPMPPKDLELHLVLDNYATHSMNGGFNAPGRGDICGVRVFHPLVTVLSHLPLRRAIAFNAPPDVSAWAEFPGMPRNSAPYSAS